MRPRSLYTGVSVAILATATLAAQKAPDFNGQWTLDEKRTTQARTQQESRIASGADPLLTHTPRAASLHVKVAGGPQATAKVVGGLQAAEAQVLTLTWSGASGKQVDTWTLDGVDRSTTTSVKTSAEWKGKVIEIKQKLKGAPPVRTELSMDGVWLVVKDTQHDRESEKDSAYKSRRTYYKRTGK